MPNKVELTGIWWNVDSLRAQREAGWAGRVVHRVVDLAMRYDPDWVCIQEGHEYPNGNLQEMIHAATDWDFRFQPGVSYSNGHNGRVQGDDFTEGLATFSKLPIKGSETVTLGANPQTNGHNWHCEQHVLDTTVQTAGGDVTVGNTHLTVIRPRISHYAARRREIIAFREHVASAGEEPYVVGGDLNSLRFQPAMLLLRRILDLRTGTWKQPTWTYGGDPQGVLKSLNLDFVGSPRDNPLQIQEVRVLERHGSDHRPLQVKCVLDSLIASAA